MIKTDAIAGSIPKGPLGVAETLPPDVRVVSGPTRCEHLLNRKVWEVIVSLPVYSSKLAMRAFRALPDWVEFDGHTYFKSGMKASDCTAWYRWEDK